MQAAIVAPPQGTFGAPPRAPEAEASPGTEETSPVIRNRLVVHLAGYDPPDPCAVHRRFARELRRFEKTWSVTAAVSEPEVGEDQAAWRVVASGPNWRVASEYRLLRWDDVVAADGQEPAWRRFPRGLLALMDFLLSGAFRGYLRTYWPYALFFLYPLVLLALVTASAALLGLLAGRLADSSLAGAAGFVVALAGLAVLAGRRLRLNHLLDDWIFARGYVRGEHPTIAPRLDRAAREIADLARAGQAEEIAIVGHSLGAVLAIDLVDRVLRLESARGGLGTPLALVSIGSSALKIGLHRGARRFRSAVERVASSPAVFWAEYQAPTDVMNFYGADPLAAMGLSAARPPVVRRVRIDRMLDPAVYKRIRLNFYRVHCQFVSGNDRRAPYDYFMLFCGPIPIEEQVRSPDGAASAIGPDGTLRASQPSDPPAPESPAPESPAARRAIGDLP